MGRHTAARYAGALLSTTAGLLLALWVQPLVDASVMLLLAVMIAAWVSGLWPGLLAAVLATLALDYFFTAPLYTLSVNATGILHIIVFAGIAALAVSACAGLRSAERSLKQARDELDAKVRERTADLTSANQRLGAQYAVSTALAASDSLDTSLPDVLRIIGTTLNWDWGALWNVDREAHVLRCASTWCTPETRAARFAIDPGLTFAPGHGLPGLVWESARPRWMSDIVHDADFVRVEAATEAGLRSAVAFPVLIGGDAIAVVEFFSAAVRRPDRDQLETLSAIGGQIGQFIERRRAEEARAGLLLREREAHAQAVAAQKRFSDLVNSIEGIVWEADARTFQFTFVSKQAERVLGYPVDEWLRDRDFWKDHIHPDDRAWVVNACITATTAGRDHDFEYAMVASDGAIVWVRDLVSVVVENGEVVALRGVMFDIGTRKLAEQALRNQADLLNLTHDTVFTRDMNDVIRYWNRGAEEQYGWTSQEAIGQVSHRLMRTIFSAPLADINAELLRSGRWEGELRHATRDGSEVIVASRWSLQRDADGKPIAILETNNDITKRKHAEDALREQADLLNLTHDSLFVRDQQDVIRYWNRGAEELYGWTRDEALNRVTHDLLRTSFSTPVEQITAQMFREGRWEGELVHTKRDGARVVVASRWSVQRDAGGSPIGTLEINNDITERKRAEAELRESERRHRHIFQATGTSIWEEDFSRVKAAIDNLKGRGVDDFREYLRTDPDFIDQAIALVRIVEVNEATLKLFGAGSKDELLVSLHTVFTPETRDVFAGELIAIFDGKTSFEGETVLRKLNGERIVALFSVSFPPPDAAFDTVLVSIIDITERKRVEQELEELAARLIHAQEEERRRIGRELHDHISQMLGVLTIRLDQLRADEATPPALAATLEELRGSTAEVTTDVHSLSHRLHSSALDYLGLVPALQRLICEFSARYSIAIDFAHASVPVSLPSEVALCLFRVTEESLTNIAKHSHATQAQIRLRQEPDSLHLSIEDSGTGFDVGELGRHVGLGFISMRERLRVLRGSVTIRSLPARGTRIDARIPAPVAATTPGEALHT